MAAWWVRIFGVAASAGALSLAVLAGSCKETACEETRTCESSAGGSGGSGGTGASDGGGTSGTGGIPPVGSFSISVTPSSVTVGTTESVELEVGVTRNQFTAPISIGCGSLPSGTTCSSEVATGNQKSVKLTLTAGSGIHGMYKAVVTGQAGVTQKTAAFDLTLRGGPAEADLSFGTSGSVVSVISGEWTRPRALAFDPQGRIYVVGETGAIASKTSAYFVARYSPDGAPDPTFGTQGSILRYTVPDTGSHTATGVAVDTEGRPVVGGFFFSPTKSSRMVARFDDAGNLDPTFTASGELVDSDGETNALALQPDDKVVVVGRDIKNPTGSVVRRHSGDGSPDLGFGTASFTTLGIPTNSVLSSVALSGNKIVVAGTNYATSVDPVVARLTPAGAMDSFGTAGIATYDLGGVEKTTSLVVLADGKIVLGGTVDPSDGFLLKLDSLGVKDASFGSGGSTKLASNAVSALALDGSLNLVFAGKNSSGYFTLNRYLPNGTPDGSFLTQGTIAIATVNPVAIVVRPDGRAVVLGSEVSSGEKLYLARFWM